MSLQQWWRGLVAAVLIALVGVTVAGATGEQFLPVLRGYPNRLFAGILWTPLLST